MTATENHAGTHTEPGTDRNIDTDHELLIDERDQLLRSIEDLEREHAAGDIDPTDYRTLLDSYTARTAAVLRQLRGETGNSAVRAVTPVPKRPVWRASAVVGAVVVCALGAGILVARSAGERVGNAGLTGSVRSAASERDDRVAALLDTARNNLAADPIAALKAYDEVHTLDPTNVESVAYAGWLVRNVGRSASDDAQRKELITVAIGRLEEAIAIDPTYPDALAFRAIMYLRDQDDPASAAKLFDALDKLNPPDQIKQLTSAAAEEARAAVRK